MRADMLHDVHSKQCFISGEYLITLINILVAVKSGRRTFEHSLLVFIFGTLAYVHCLTQETTYQLFPTLKQFAQDFRIVDVLYFKHLFEAIRWILLLYPTLHRHLIHFTFTHSLFNYSITNHSSIIQ
jgi:hypothetical protein